MTGLSRGDGKEGEDITENLKTIRDIPHKIALKDFPEEIDIRGEIFIQNDDFKKISNKFANPRNAASGSLRQKNPNDTKKIPLKFIAYTFGYERGLSVENQSDFINKLNVLPTGTEGYKTAEVTLGGIDTNEINSATMECKKYSGLYFIGEVVDVTGHLGGYNFQWAWSSGYVAGQYA